jgi:hypothetical protein
MLPRFDKGRATVGTRFRVDAHFPSTVCAPAQIGIRHSGRRRYGRGRLRLRQGSLRDVEGGFHPAMWAINALASVTGFKFQMTAAIIADTFCDHKLPFLNQPCWLDYAPLPGTCKPEIQCSTHAGPGAQPINPRATCGPLFHPRGTRGARKKALVERTPPRVASSSAGTGRTLPAVRRRVEQTLPYGGAPAVDQSRHKPRLAARACTGCPTACRSTPPA